MNILGLHFGHDAGVSVLRDGQIAACVMRERHSRVKHAISLQFKNIETAVNSAGLRLDQIDYCAITSTQCVELIIDDGKNFSIRFDRHPDHVAPATFESLLKSSKIDPQTRLVSSLMEIFYDPRQRDSYLFRHYGYSFPEYRNRQASDFCQFGWMDEYAGSTLWRGGTLSEIGSQNFLPVVNDATRMGFHYPVTVKLAGRDVAGYFVAHHMAHAGSTYYQSGFDSAAVLTHDGYGGGDNTLSGQFFWGEREKLYPLTPHYLILGVLYEMIGVRLGLGWTGAPGKLMGLAAYGNPRFFDRAFVGNSHDWAKAGMGVDPWWNHCLRLAHEMGYDLAPLSDPSQMTAAINVDIAASTQKLFEESLLAAVEALHNVIGRAGKKTRNLCLSGGTALNCPANSRIFREGRFANVFIEPGCDDSGLAIGAAKFLYHNILGNPVPAQVGEVGGLAYLGGQISPEEIVAALEYERGDVKFDLVPNAAEAAAQDLAANRIIGWFEGRSEIGPRALGHRSILADARHADNWPRVNRLKGREAWRPFAPAVLESESAKFFDGAPSASPYMLFTAVVRSNQLPAITHFDGTARLQTVNASTGEFFHVLKHFFALTGVPVLLNTSFNGPGEPIVETPADALRFLIRSSLDALYIGGYRVVRRES